jgi:transcriptional regulator with XRE-family HTH domain
MAGRCATLVEKLAKENLWTTCATAVVMLKVAHMSQQTELGTIPAWTVGDRLRKARESTGMDRQQMALAIGISRRSIATYEASDQLPRRPILVTWALATGVPRDWLETGKAHSPEGPNDEGLPRLDSNQQPFGEYPAALSYLPRPLLIVPHIVPVGYDALEGMAS